MSEKAVTRAYSYFDTPDGEDTFKKLWAVLKPTVVIAGGIATGDVLLRSYPKGLLQTLGRYAFIGGPIIGVVTTFVLTTNTLAGIRKKDDKVNWFLGGAVAGSCLGLWARRPIVGFNGAMGFGIIAFAWKEAQLQGWPLIPDDLKVRRGGATSWSRDFSLIAERPMNWTTGTK